MEPPPPPVVVVEAAEVVPNRLAVGMEEEEEDEVVELVEIVGLLAIKENAGFGAADESEALCPKVKDGFAASALDVSLLSAGLPKVNAGGGCSVGALGLQKEKPPVMAGGGAASVSLLAPPKTKADGAEGAAASFFSSGFPKVNAGAAGSLSAACRDPNVVPPGGAVVAKVGAPSLPNTDPAVAEVVVVAELVFVDVVSLDDAAPSLFSSDEAGGAKAAEDDEVEVVVVSDVFSSDFGSPKVKPPFEALLSVLDEPVPNMIPPPVPNLNPEPAAGWSDFLSSLEATPNLKPSEELPNLNPEEAVVSLEVVSDEELPNGTPNLNPPDGEEEDDDSVNEPPNLKPPDPNPEVLSDVPNLKPPELEVEEPNVDEPDVAPADEPKALGSTLAPGLAA